MMEYFQIAAGVLAPLLALTVIWTSLQQHRLGKQGLSLNKQRLSFDVRLTLLDKRLDLFRGMQRFIVGVCQQPRHISEEYLYDYLRETALGEFIFDERRKDILDKVYDKGWDLLLHNSRREKDRTKPQHEEDLGEEKELFRWFKERLTQNKDDFRDYFEFK